eukprot:CAMPEP_0184488464 /NCGR_PEP_ID=MMETSP0113_2-20130426/12037_1 /TAXON_ID=91329 /ORGANISM="Norrisiella sphaerica, Strain BC52" /LENGTH=196 /DNA_ID=CAMNT_0026871255 /DNA_START=18 /DNA_END=604 /DNA_ORIENTATION=+
MSVWQLQTESRVKYLESQLDDVIRRISKLEKIIKKPQKLRRSISNEAKGRGGAKSSSSSHILNEHAYLNELKEANDIMRRKLGKLEDTVRMHIIPKEDSSSFRYVCRNCSAVFIGLFIIALIVSGIAALAMGIICYVDRDKICPHPENQLAKAVEVAIGATTMTLVAFSCFWCYEDPVRYVFGTGFYVFDVCTQLT